MPGTFSKIYIQVVFAVRNRAAMIEEAWEAQLYQYIGGIIRGHGQFALAINGMPDQIHILMSIKGSCCLSDLVREIKKSSGKFINDRRLTKVRFNWQSGYGAFSYGHSQLGQIMSYIDRQKEHHYKLKFKSEYTSFLKRFEIKYDPQYLFEWID